MIRRASARRIVHRRAPARVRYVWRRVKGRLRRVAVRVGTAKPTRAAAASGGAVRLGRIPNGKALRADAAAAYNRMYAAAARRGIRLTPVSGYRSYAQQVRLYALYRAGRGNLAAKPGKSNHNRGIAVDIATGSTRTATYRWLAANARAFGFRRTVPSEPWHWEFR